MVVNIKMFTVFECDLCDVARLRLLYVGFKLCTRPHLYQRVGEQENSSSSIGKNFRDISIVYMQVLSQKLQKQV